MSRLRLLLALTTLSLLALMPLAARTSPLRPMPAPANDAAPCSASAAGIPPRQSTALVGSAFALAMAESTDAQREEAVRRELLAGNLPRFLRDVQPTTVFTPLASGRVVRITLCLLSDYLSVGSDEDFLRVPMGLPSALAVASRLGFTLPTRHMVDLIYRQATVRLKPQPLPAGDGMRSIAYLLRHQALVAQQAAAARAPAGALTAGHKKDLVLSPRLWAEPGRVAIYGWHRSASAPIQPLSTVHGARYADYSHGVRLVGRTVWLDGVPTSILALLADPLLAPLLSDEGPLPLAGDLLAQAGLLPP